MSFIVILLLSTSVRSEIASNLLELQEGLSVTGDFYEKNNNGTMTYSVDRIWHDTFLDEDVIELSRERVYSTILESNFNISRQLTTSIVKKVNRTVFMPIQKFSVKSGGDNITVFVDISESLNTTIDNNLKVTLNGVTYLFSEIDTESPLYSEIEIWVILWFLGYIFDLFVSPLTKYAISPQAAVGQNIDYGQYQGEVIGYTEYFINEKEYFEVIEVHHDEVIVNINFFGEIIPHTIGETTLLYEKSSGIILSSLEYNSTSEEYYYFNATNISGIKPAKTSFSIVIAWSTILIGVLIVLKGKEKEIL